MFETRLNKFVNLILICSCPSQILIVATVNTALPVKLCLFSSALKRQSLLL
jgi:hypothetical protein